jgi:hypothetical protein
MPPADDAIKVLFLPGNPSHVKSQRPVAEELVRRGHAPSFLIRDGVVDEYYRVGKCLDRDEFITHVYQGYYRSDINRALPELRSFFRARREVDEFLGLLDFDVAVFCNDDSGLFDRLVIDSCRRRSRAALLIQESVRPAQRVLPILTRLRQQSLTETAGQIANALGSKLSRGPFFRKRYGHSPCNIIAVAGERFRRQLIAEGVPASRIRVTGQPRLDGALQPPTGLRKRRDPDKPAVLLFCNQPVPGAEQALDQMFRDLVHACDDLDNVRLLFKLHPDDLPQEHWLALLAPNEGRNLLEVTSRRPLKECFDQAAAVMTIASTTSLEAMAEGLPVGLVDYLPVAWYLPFAESGAALSVTSAADLKESIRQLLFDEEARTRLVARSGVVFPDELHLRDGQSASRIVDFIEESLGIASKRVLCA